jgi:hypothetical protein
MAAGIDAPPAPPPGVRIVQPSTPPKPPPAPTHEIHVAVGRDPNPTHEPPKPGTAKDRLSQALYKKAGIDRPASGTPPADQVRPGQPSPDPGATPPEPGEGTPPDPGSEGTDPATPPAKPATPPADPKKGKVNPWHLVEEYKGKVATLEKQIVEGKGVTLAEQEKKSFLDQIQKLSDRNKALEDEMRFVNYEQSEEFKSKYQEPYEKAFSNAVQEMSELTVSDEAGNVRQVNHQDILQLCQMPLAEARKFANDKYGDFADDMMQHRKEIRNLFQARQQALKEAKENGSKRLKEQTDLAQATIQKIQQHVTDTWTSANEAVTKDPSYGTYFTPVEGDQDGNQRLAKGFALVDRAFTENPNDPRLSTEERTAVVKRHAAVRARAAGFGRLRSWYEAAKARVEELEKELGQYKASTPETGGAPAGPEGAAAGAPSSGWARVQAALRAKAR